MFCENYVNAQAALDPSELLLCFQNIIVKSGKKGFDLFKQQDGSEIMSYVFEELCGESSHAQEVLTTTLKHQVTCHKCF